MCDSKNLFSNEDRFPEKKYQEAIKNINNIESGKTVLKIYIAHKT